MVVVPVRQRRRKNQRGRYRGRRAGILVRARSHADRLPLPSILLANVQSLDNEMAELWVPMRFQGETKNTGIICLTESWLDATVPDSAIELPGYSHFRVDRTKTLTRKERGGVYVRDSWCSDVRLAGSLCCPDVEFIMLQLRPFWMPQEFCAVFHWCVYTPKSLHRHSTERAVQADQ